MKLRLNNYAYHFGGARSKAIALPIAWLMIACAVWAETPLLQQEVSSREYTVSVGRDSAQPAEAFSLEYSFYVDNDQPTQFREVLSREVDLLVASNEVPAVVENLVVDPSPDGSSVSLAWTDYDELAQLDVIRYNVYVQSSPFESVAAITPYINLAAGTQSYQVTGLTPWASYAFAVVAVDSLGQFHEQVLYRSSHPILGELLSREVGVFVGGTEIPEFGNLESREFALLIADAAPPPAITDLEVVLDEQGVIRLDWQHYDEEATPDVGVYRIYVLDQAFSTIDDQQAYIREIEVPRATQKLDIVGLSSSQTHYIAVVPVDVGGNFTPEVAYAGAYHLAPQISTREFSVHVGSRRQDPDPISRELSFLAPNADVPDPVTGISSGFTAATSVSAFAAIDLDWQAYNENLQLDVVEYEIYTSSIFFDDVTALSPTTRVPAGSQSHVLTGLDGSQIYYVAVVAVDQLGNRNDAVRSISAQASVSALGEVSTLAVQSFADQLIFTWVPPDNAGLFLDRYRIYLDGDASPITIASNLTSYIQSNLSSATGHSFRITTVDILDSESPGLTLVAATWLPNPVLNVVALDSKIKLDWDPVEPASLVSTHHVYLEAAPFNNVSGLTPVTSTQGTAVTLDGLFNDQKYYLAVVVENISDAWNADVIAVSAMPEEDLIAPDAPGFTAIAPDTGVAADDQITNETDLSVSFTVQPDVTAVRILDPSTGVLYGPFDPADGTAVDIVFTAPGQRVLELVAYDDAGNASTPTLVDLLIDQTPPAPVIQRTDDASSDTPVQFSIDFQESINPATLESSDLLVAQSGQAVSTGMTIASVSPQAYTVTLSEDLPYGAYDFIIGASTVEDLAGNSKPTTTPYAWLQAWVFLDLAAGWNLVSVPNDLVSPSISAMPAGYRRAYQRVGRRIRRAVEIKPMNAYWLHSDQDAVLRLQAISPLSVVDSQKQLLRGWNVVSFPYFTTTDPELLLSGSGVRARLQWNGRRLVRIPTLAIGKTYYIFVESPGIVDFNSSAP